MMETKAVGEGEDCDDDTRRTCTHAQNTCTIHTHTHTHTHIACPAYYGPEVECEHDGMSAAGEEELRVRVMVGMRVPFVTATHRDYVPVSFVLR